MPISNPDRQSRFRGDERSASEVLGYVVVFALVITSIGFIVVSGVESLENVRDAEQASNAERAFDVVADNMAAIYERNSPSRATEIDLAESELFYGNNVSIAITVDDGTATTFEFELQPVELRITDDTSLVYEGGAVFREQDEGGVMLREPPLLFTESRVHTPIIQTTTANFRSVGRTTVLLRGQSENRSVLVSDTDGTYNEVTIEVVSPRYELWQQYFEENSALSCSVTDSTNTVECSVTDPEIVYVNLQRIGVSIIL
jgi:hypothetical protein